MSKATERQEPKSIVEVPWSVVRDKDDKDPKMKQSGARHRAQRVEGCSGSETSSDGGPINMGGPLNVQAAPKINMGPPPATPGLEKCIFSKSIVGPKPKPEV
ncbi:hypothetical protein Tco_0804501 [Tanacetum coccineum]|uniref:Uncharacterized protein n=1 Tax=Tanacetum coccineum TaxID=301880 RepID=A0ABQ5A910_9ASTR